MKHITVDPHIVKLRLDKIRIGIKQLQAVHDISEEEFISNWMIHRATERNLQIIAQAIIDICTHLVAHNHWGTPETYSDAVRIVSQQNVIDDTLAENLIELVKLRNVIVHLYLEIDLKIVYESAKRVIKDSRIFIDAITKFTNF